MTRRLNGFGVSGYLGILLFFVLLAALTVWCGRCGERRGKKSYSGPDRSKIISMVQYEVLTETCYFTYMPTIKEIWDLGNGKLEVSGHCGREIKGWGAIDDRFTCTVERRVDGAYYCYGLHYGYGGRTY